MRKIRLLSKWQQKKTKNRTEQLEGTLKKNHLVQPPDHFWTEPKIYQLFRNFKKLWNAALLTYQWKFYFSSDLKEKYVSQINIKRQHWSPKRNACVKYQCPYYSMYPQPFSMCPPWLCHRKKKIQMPPVLLGWWSPIIKKRFLFLSNLLNISY